MWNGRLKTYLTYEENTNFMGKIIQIEVPDELADMIEKDASLKRRLSSKVVEALIRDYFLEGKVSKDVLNYLAREEDVLLEDEEKNP